MTSAARARDGLRWTGMTLVAFMLLLPAASAVARDFFPEFSRFEGYMEAGFTHESYENRTRGRGISTEDTTVVERLKLGALGYIYHPRLITFRLQGAWGLQQEYFESAALPSARSSKATEEYNIRAWLLPEHPYNVEVYATRRNPVLSGRLAPGVDSVTVEKGAIARYLKMPWSLETGINDTSTSGRNTFAYDSRSTYASASSFLKTMTTTLSYSHLLSSQSADRTQNVRDRCYFTNQFNLPQFTLNSRVERYDQEQRGPAAVVPMKSDRLIWNEDLSIPLPGRFLTEMSYAVYKDRVMSVTPGQTAPEQFFSRTETGRFMLRHHLYASLRTSYSLQYTTADSTTGDTESVSESLNVLYTKIIPGGRLSAGAFASETEQTREGAPVVLREEHEITVPGSFLLNGALVDRATITVLVQEPSGSLVPLAPVFYSVQQAGTRIEIFILNLPAPLPLGTSYRFHIDYAMLPSESVVMSRQTGYNLGLHLFDNRVNPYYQHSRSEQSLIRGVLSGGTDSTTSDTVGINVVIRPFSLMGEYVNFRSQTSPFESWRTSVDVSQELSLTAKATARLFHSRTVYDDSELRTLGYADEFTQASFQLMKDLPERHLNFSAGGSYGLRETFVTTHSYSANAVLLWRAGKLAARMGASSTYSYSTLTTGQQRTSAVYYYLTLTRQLF